MGWKRAVVNLLHRSRAGGLRWWSAFFGEWRTIVLFLDRLSMVDLVVGTPTPLDPETPAVVQAADAIGVGIRRG